MKYIRETLTWWGPWLLGGIGLGGAGVAIGGQLGVALLLAGGNLVGPALWFIFHSWWAWRKRQALHTQLCWLRQARGLSLSQVYKATGINVIFLEEDPDNLFMSAHVLVDLVTRLSVLYQQPITLSWFLLS